MTLPSAGFSTSSVSPDAEIDPFPADELLVRLDALEDVGHRLGPSGFGGRHDSLVMVSHRTPRGNGVPVSGPEGELRRIRALWPGPRTRTLIRCPEAEGAPTNS